MAATSDSLGRSGRPPRSVTEWFQRRCRRLPWVLSASLLSSSLAPLTLAAAPPSKWQPKYTQKSAAEQAAISANEAETSPQLSDQRVKLNYFGATWQTVLEDVAKQTGSQIIAERVPSGRFTRRDGNQYTRTEALRIINQEIESHGFRVIEKGNFLVVIDLPSQRPRYQAATVGARAGAAQQPNAEPPTQPRRQFASVAPPPREVVEGETSLRGGRSGIQQVAHEEAAADGPAARLLEDRAAEARQPMTMVVFRARNQRAAELAKRVYRAFGSRAELVDAGRDGLPAMRVRSDVGAKPAPVQFSIAIDEEREELLIDARQKDGDALLKLLRRLDAPHLPNESLHVVSSTRTACQAAVQLPAQLEILRAAAQDAAGGRGRIELAQADAQPAAPGDQAPPPGGQGTLSDIVGNLKGEVGVEAIEELGVLILRGATKDVEQVMEVIRQLEKLSEQTAPQMHLLHLSHVNSEALAELLSTVYEQMTKFPGKATQTRQSVGIFPVSKPNAVLIVAPKNDLQSIIDLATELDAPVEPETEFQVFHLKSAIAVQVEELLTQLSEEPKGLSARIVVRADARSNSVIVKGKPRDLVEVGALIRKLDRDAPETINQVQIVRLKNAVAAELAAVINAAIQSVLSPPSNQGASQLLGGVGGAGGGGQVAEEFRAVTSRALEILAVDADGARKLRSGILADIRITADPRVNALVVTAPEASMNLIVELINLLDKPTDQVAEIKVFTLANADAQLMVQQLGALFNVQTTGTGAGGAQRAQQIGIQVAGAEDASSGLIPLRFSVDTRTNSVIAIGAADALRVVEAIMLRLDESDVRARKQSVYRLKNSPATTIAQAVTQFLTEQQSLAQQDPNLISTVEQLEREVIVVAEPVSNSLMISATPRYYDEILKLIQKLDEAPRQVIIQALLVEVELENTDEFGVEMGFQDSILFDRSILETPVTINQVVQNAQGQQLQNQTIISQSASPGFLFGNPATPLGNNIGKDVSAVGTQGLSNFSLGRVNGDLGFGGLVLSASSENVSMLLRALAQNRRVNVLSRPQIRALDNQQAQIQQGQIVPVITGGQANGTTGAFSPQITRDPSGVLLTVTPRISPDGDVVMAITAEKSQYNLNAGVPIFTNTTTGDVVQSPVKDISNAVTVVSVPDGQTIVLGGLITSRTDTIERKVPWLGDIPIIGWGFRYDYNQVRRTELLIFLTPRIICDDAYAEHIKDVEMSKMHFLESQAEEIHGPLRGIPASEVIDGSLLNGPMTMPQDLSPAVPSAPPATPAPPLPAEPLPAGEPLPAAPPPPEGASARRAPVRIRDRSVAPAAGAVRLGSLEERGAVQPAVATEPAPKPAARVKLGRNSWADQ